MRLLIIGGGNMGGAIVRGVIAQKVLTPRDIGVLEIDESKRAALAAEIDCAVLADAVEAREAVGKSNGSAGDRTQVLLAVKPQLFPDVARGFSPVSKPRVFISIMAGLESSSIHHALGPQARIVRCMPNTACQIGKGMTAISLGMGASEGDELLARQIFDALGKTVMLDEQHLHAVTAVSGSGPAYVYLLAEAMQKAAAKIDLPADVARMLVTQTIVGAAGMLDQKGSDPVALRKAVTSPKGTTEAAMKVLDHAGFEKLVREAIKAARDRGIELNASK